MEDLASPVYDATPAAVGEAFPALGAVAKISSPLVGYLAGLIVVAPYIGGAAQGLPMHAPQALQRRTPRSWSGS